MMEKNLKKVCVTGGAGYLASFLVKHLLERGYIVHATLRSLTDIYNPIQFSSAVEGCEIVVHMATPLQHYNTSSEYKNTSEAAVGGVKMIMETCMKSNTVKKLIYTASVVAASPLKDDGSGYKDFMDETCWSPLNISYQMLSDYVHSKTLAEKEVLSYNGKGIEVVSLACGLVGGDTIQSTMSESMGALISQATNDGLRYKVLRCLEDLLAKVPIAHIQDVTQAHIFSMENSHINGRFLCASAFLKSAQIASLIQKSQQNISIPKSKTPFIDSSCTCENSNNDKFHHLEVSFVVLLSGWSNSHRGGSYPAQLPGRVGSVRICASMRGSLVGSSRFIEDVKRQTSWGSRKLENLGFQYKCDAEKIIDDSLFCAKRLGNII
ncbi:hypothetical protein DH2020_029157 [Rehmannia glutinosa]|uniref:NAD-dependent epimerase/dehydratase domain-containing protein n=1 Tax=Rehmannia glutinosa TaxID=99300 RepID=A0ABR0VT06_REHGL